MTIRSDNAKAAAARIDEYYGTHDSPRFADSLERREAVNAAARAANSKGRPQPSAEYQRAKARVELNRLHTNVEWASEEFKKGRDPIGLLTTVAKSTEWAPVRRRPDTMSRSTRAVRAFFDYMKEY